jgi:hypothetical protein
VVLDAEEEGAGGRAHLGVGEAGERK